MSRTFDKLVQYGIGSELADKATLAGLNVKNIKSLSQANIVSKFGLSEDEAKELKQCVQRQPIDQDVVNLLLDSSNYTCCVCKGAKGSSYILHHIEEYHKSQDNSYNNLIVLCPNDHDLAHRPGSLTLNLSADNLYRIKAEWEHQVRVANVQRAAKQIIINDDAVDYINVSRIESLCLSLFGKIPGTSETARLRSANITDSNGCFDQKYVRENISSGRYLFDYTSASEPEHYRQLMQKVSENIGFEDLDQARGKGYEHTKPLEGQYAFFIGGVTSKRPDLPITNASPPLVMKYSTNKVLIEWDLDPNYLMSMSSISRMGRKNRYIIYCLVRTVEQSEDKKSFTVIASPLLIAQPSKYIHKTPAIAYQKQYEAYKAAGLIEENEDA